MELMQPFLSPAIGFERVQDIVGGDFLSGGRGGRTAEGKYIYSPTDSLEDKFNKAFVHIIKGAEPGIVSSGRKIKDALQGDVTGAGKPAKLADELLALFTGTRIIRIDVKKDLKWIAAETNRLLRAVDETEKFYKSKDYKDRPPSIMVAEFDKMQQEAFEIQRDLYMKIKDMQMLDLSLNQIRQILDKAGMNRKLVSNLTMGYFTPITYSKPRFESKIIDIEGVAEDLTEKSDQYIYNVDKNFLFPRRDLDRVKQNWGRKKFFPETYNEETRRWEGGYRPELEGAVTNDKGNVVYDENGKIKKEPTFLDKAVPYIKEKISPLSGLMGKSQTPLPPTPGIDAQQFAQANQINPQTGLTHTENALLSNEEKAIKQRQQGRV
jgi:hypothetical protein